MAKERTDAQRRIRQSDRLARVLRLLQLIQSPGNWNATTISKKLECSERTVYRDLQTLTVAGIPWYFDDFSQSYRIREGYRGRIPRIPTSPDDDPQDSIEISSQTDDARSIATLAREAAQRLLTEAEGVVLALDRLTKAIEEITGPRSSRTDSRKENPGTRKS
jgi:predicted DNA-binding transcriptional regulator YafY